jgi:flagellar motor switch protein FliN/FliY
MTTTNRSDVIFSMAFFKFLAKAMNMACDCPWSITTVTDEEVAVDEAEPVRIMLTLDGSLCGESLLELNSSEAHTFVSSQPNRPVNELEEEESEVLRKLTETASLAFCAAVGQEYGAFTVRVSLAPKQLFERKSVVQAKATTNDGSSLSIAMCHNLALSEALSSRLPEESAAGGGGVEAKKVLAEQKNPEPVNMDLVMNVELNVTLRFGQRHLTLREVLDLTSGAVVELDRQVDEPVELLLDGEVIARGEAVVIDGNYGLRVSEVIKPVSSMVLD